MVFRSRFKKKEDKRSGDLASSSGMSIGVNGDIDHLNGIPSINAVAKEDLRIIKRAPPTNGIFFYFIQVYA